MAARRRADKRRGELTGDARAWLDGKPCGFFRFKHNNELETLWLEHGDTNSMFWRRGVGLPITLEHLEGFEDLWLNAGKNDEYGGNSFFVYRYYSNDEKQTLWDARGDKSLYRWQPGMRKPERFDNQRGESVLAA